MHRRSALVSARKAAGYTQESLAAALNIDRSTINRWEAGRNGPVPYIRPKLARLLGQSTRQLQELLEDSQEDLDVVPDSMDIDRAIDWLDQHCAWSARVSRKRVLTALKRADGRVLTARNAQRARVCRSEVADRLANYYRVHDSARADLYRAHHGGRSIVTSIATQPEWRNLACPLTPAEERLIFTGSSDAGSLGIDDVAAAGAVRRLAESAVMKVRLVDSPVYRLLSLEPQRDFIAGRLGLTSVIEYALTADLLEGELLDALVNDAPTDPGLMPLRDRYLPDLDSVLDLSGRLCAGGALALCAIARPVDSYRRSADYLLLVQERSAHVLNAAHRLSVMPKGFHKPFGDYRADAQVSATLRRELEEELFGREDIDSTVSRHMSASPMHLSRLSAPMRWLTGVAGAMRMECTGFGLNLVSGNYEFASLIVIDDEEFWVRYGGEIEANWESSCLRLFSSLDRELLGTLIFDEHWSNEGLFAFLQGLRRLAALGGKRVDAPEIEID